jgi:hypothetical protein
MLTRKQSLPQTNSAPYFPWSAWQAGGTHWLNHAATFVWFPYRKKLRSNPIHLRYVFNTRRYRFLFNELPELDMKSIILISLYFCFVLSSYNGRWRFNCNARRKECTDIRVYFSWTRMLKCMEYRSKNTEIKLFCIKNKNHQEEQEYE